MRAARHVDQLHADAVGVLPGFLGHESEDVDHALAVHEEVQALGEIVALVDHAAAGVPG